MFDELVSQAQSVRGAGAVGGWARVENAACARRLQGMVAMLDARHAADGSAEREQWYLDNWGAVSAEIGAAQQITSGAASNQLLVATALRDRLPKVAARFAEGFGTYQLMAMIVWRIALIKDPEALDAVDSALASALSGWEPMSVAKAVAAIDAWVSEVDPHALRRTQTQARGRSVQINVDDGEGMGSLWGSLFASDAKALDDRLDALARGVCEGDPRTVDQRRSDALGALAAGADRLACLCGEVHDDVAVSSTVVYVIAHEDTITDVTPAAAAEEAALDGAEPVRTSGRPLREVTLAEALEDPVPAGFAATRPGAMMGGPFLPGPVLRRAALHATVRKIFHPGDAPPELRYRPSQRLAEFVRCRDLTCRFPGCDVAATDCDVDHTVPYPVGPTQASNLKCLCRFHHLLKTFWGGVCGWRDRQLPDGTVHWFSPGGQTYVTRPGSRLLFPSLCQPTAPVAVVASAGESTPNPGLMMPRRARTRAEDRRRRIDEERRLNEEAGGGDGVLAM